MTFDHDTILSHSMLMIIGEDPRPLRPMVFQLSWWTVSVILRSRLSTIYIHRQVTI